MAKRQRGLFVVTTTEHAIDAHENRTGVLGIEVLDDLFADVFSLCVEANGGQADGGGQNDNVACFFHMSWSWGVSMGLFVVAAPQHAIDAHEDRTGVFGIKVFDDLLTDRFGLRVEANGGQTNGSCQDDDVLCFFHGF